MAIILPPAVPDAEELRALLSQLLGKPVALKAPVGPPKPNIAPQVQAMYCAADGTARAMASVDLPLAANLGAALAMMPAATAAEAARSGRMNELLSDCLHEVLNVCARLLNRPGGMHVVLKKVASAPDSLPADVRAALSKAPLQREYDLEIAGYGRGKIVFRAA